MTAAGSFRTAFGSLFLSAFEVQYCSGSSSRRRTFLAGLSGALPPVGADVCPDVRGCQRARGRGGGRRSTEKKKTKRVATRGARRSDRANSRLELRFRRSIALCTCCTSCCDLPRRKGDRMRLIRSQQHAERARLRLRRRSIDDDDVGHSLSLTAERRDAEGSVPRCRCSGSSSRPTAASRRCNEGLARSNRRGNHFFLT